MKRKMLKGIAVFLVVMTTVFSFSACGSGEAASEQTQFEGDSVEGALDGVTLSVGTSGLFAPFTYYDTDGTTLTGFDLDVISALQDYLGFEINGDIQAMDYSALAASVAEGKLDIALAALSMTDERKEVMNFSEPYYNGGKYVAVNKETSPSELTSVDMLTSGDYTVAVEKGTSSHIYLEKLGVPESAMEIHDTITTAYESLEQGKVDCMIQDAPSLAYYLATKSDTKITNVGEQFATDDTYGIAMSFNLCEEHTDIVDIFNRALEDLTEDGTITALKQEWCE